MVKGKSTSKTLKAIRKQIAQANRQLGRAVTLLGVSAGLLVACAQTGASFVRQQSRKKPPVVTQTQQKDDEGEVLRCDQVVVKSEVPFDTTRVYDVVEQMPQFPGGPNALCEYLQKNLKYPPECRDSCIQGRVIVCFVVERDGSINKVKVVKTVHPKLNAEALRVVEAMPKWIPGRVNGVTVAVKYCLPVTFRLPDDDFY